MSKMKKSKDDFSQSELRLLRIICDTHTMDDEPRSSNNEAYQITKESMLTKLKRLVDEQLEDTSVEKGLFNECKA
ncbi:MAG: hypothetical protein U9O83_06165 [Campylobacterota bacterium]|nr:hypothetical protein [Campylobacterota bacterium]